MASGGKDAVTSLLEYAAKQIGTVYDNNEMQNLLDKFYAATTGGSKVDVLKILEGMHGNLIMKGVVFTGSVYLGFKIAFLFLGKVIALPLVLASSLALASTPLTFLAAVLYFLLMGIK